MKTKLYFMAAVFAALSFTACRPKKIVKKPVVYLYPQTRQNVAVKLHFNGKLRATYPLYHECWSLMADTDGTLTDLVTGQQYHYLFYDGVSNIKYPPFNEGFALSTDTVTNFLEHQLTTMGLNSKERNDMISFWLPELNQSTYCYIRFRQNSDCNQVSRLEISPRPDTEIRVMMEFLPSNEYHQLPAQKIKPGTRKGFTVVEWGGVNLSDEALLPQ